MERMDGGMGGERMGGQMDEGIDVEMDGGMCRQVKWKDGCKDGWRDG